MTADESAEISELLRRAAVGESEAAGELFGRYSERLKRLVRLRLNPQLAGRVDESDVLQEAFVEATRRLPDYVRSPTLPFYLWLRRLTLEKLIAVHRRHLGTQGRDARREASLGPDAGLSSTSASLARLLAGRLTSPSQAAARAELKELLERALEKMSPTDREILVLRHFEQLSNAESARVLGINESAASKRYLRALERLREILVEMRVWEDE